MENDINIKDALGVDIQIGNRYGYCQNSNGITTIVIGIAEKFTKTGITLKVEKTTRALYSNKAKECIYDKDKVSVKCITCFPIK